MVCEEANPHQLKQMAVRLDGEHAETALYPTLGLPNAPLPTVEADRIRRGEIEDNAMGRRRGAPIMQS